VSGLNATGTLPSFIALRPFLLTEESHINAHTSEESNPQTTLLVSTQGKNTFNSSSSVNGNQPANGHFNGRGRGKNNWGQYGRGRGYHNSLWSSFQHQSRPPSPSADILGKVPFAPTKQCQICFHYNHTALECRNRFNHSFVANNIPQSFAAMNLEEVQPTVWYPDSGASAHMTHDPSTLTAPIPYSGSSQVMVGDGTLLSINSIGSSTLPTTSKPLLLKNVLYVPSLTKNLLSIQRLCADNNSFIHFTNSIFFVKDMKTGTTLLRSNNSGFLYPLRVAPYGSSNFGLFSKIFPSSLWHQRLRHPGRESLSSLVVRKLISSASSFSNNSCNVCHLGKQTRMSFLLSSNNASSPFILIHSDEWHSPIVSNFDIVITFYFLMITPNSLGFT